jgi:transposase
VTAVDTDLGDDPTKLRARIAELEARNAELERTVAHLQKIVFGRKSERLADERHPQLPFSADELPPAPPPAHVDEAPDEEYETVTYQRRKRGATRISKDLPRERRVIEVPEEQRRCECCGEVKQPIGEEVTEQVDFVPAVTKVIETVRIKYACKKHEEAGITTPALPPQPIPKGMATAGLLAQVAVAKYKDHLPLYRQCRIFERHGVDISESTLCDWIKDVADLVLPIVAAIKASILLSAVIQSDDTGILVQDRQHQNGSRRSFLWAYLGDRGEVVFDFTQGRGREGPRLFLGDYRGYLQADAYSGYDVIYATGRVTEVACWAHARRGFFDALEKDKENATNALAAIRILYDVERQARDQKLLADARRELRQQQAKPVLDAMQPWLKALKVNALPKSPMGQAIGYALRQWDALNRYLNDGRLEIDNNGVERQIRSVAVGRKNWLFAGSDEGGKRAAILYSIIGTCALQAIEPWHYLKDVLQRLAEGDKPENLTPRRWKAGREPPAPAAQA